MPLLPPPLLFPSAGADGVAGLEETWQGHAVWFWCQFQLRPGFYDQIKKKTQKSKKKKDGEGKWREAIASSCNLGNDISICQSIQSPYPLPPPFFFSFLFLPCNLISPFIMWKDCKWGTQIWVKLEQTCFLFGYGYQRCGHEALTFRWKKCPHVCNSHVSGCTGEITHLLSTDCPKPVCTWKVGSYLSSSAKSIVQA